MAPATPAQRKATDKYIKSQDEIKIRVPKGRKADYQDRATRLGESLNAFVVTAVEERMEEIDGV